MSDDEEPSDEDYEEPSDEDYIYMAHQLSDYISELMIGYENTSLSSASIPLEGYYCWFSLNQEKYDEMKKIVDERTIGSSYEMLLKPKLYQIWILKR